MFCMKCGQELPAQAKLTEYQQPDVLRLRRILKKWFKSFYNA